MPLKSSHTEQEDYHRHREAEPLSFTKLNPEASRSLTPKLHSLHKKVKTGYAHSDVFRDDSHFARPISTRALALIMIPPLDAHTAPALWLRRRCPSCMARQKIRFDPSE